MCEKMGCPNLQHIENACIWLTRDVLFLQLYIYCEWNVLSTNIFPTPETKAEHVGDVESWSYHLYCHDWHAQGAGFLPSQQHDDHLVLFG